MSDIANMLSKYGSEQRSNYVTNSGKNTEDEELKKKRKAKAKVTKKDSGLPASTSKIKVYKASPDKPIETSQQKQDRERHNSYQESEKIKEEIKSIKNAMTIEKPTALSGQKMDMEGDKQLEEKVKAMDEEEPTLLETANESINGLFADGGDINEEFDYDEKEVFKDDKDIVPEGSDKSDEFLGHLSEEDRDSIYEILGAILPSLGGGGVASYAAGAESLKSSREAREKRKLASAKSSESSSHLSKTTYTTPDDPTPKFGTYNKLTNTMTDQSGNIVPNATAKQSGKYKYVTNNKTGITTVVDNQTGQISHTLSPQGLPNFSLKDGTNWEAAPYQMEELDKLANRYRQTPQLGNSVEAYTQSVNGLKALRVGGKIGDISGMVNAIRASGDKRIAEADKADYKSRESWWRKFETFFEKQDKDRGLDEQSYKEVRRLLRNYAKTSLSYIQSGIEGNLEAADIYEIPRELSAKRLGMSVDMLPPIPKNIKYRSSRRKKVSMQITPAHFKKKDFKPKKGQYIVDLNGDKAYWNGKDFETK